MYIPSQFKNENITEVKDFLQRNSFGILINNTNGKLCATHIPLELDSNENGKDVLYGHISKENPQWNGFTENDEILAIFTGPHAYISSSWYDHENVPTWNYLAVHIYGKIKILDEEATIKTLKKLVDKYEVSSENPVRVEDLSKKTMIQARGIVAFEIEINEIQAKKKLSQNRDDKNYQNIIDKLAQSGDPNSKEIAKEMTKNRQ